METGTAVQHIVSLLVCGQYLTVQVRLSSCSTSSVDQVEQHADEEDFVGLSTPLNFGALQNRACTHVMIKNDDTMEQTESLSVNINLTKHHSHLQIETPSTYIIIVDDDGENNY